MAASSSATMTGDEGFTGFTCQRCCQPLKIHVSFDSVDERSLSQLTLNDPRTSDDPAPDDSEAPQSYDTVCKPVFERPGLKLMETEGNGNNGFLVIDPTTTSKMAGAPPEKQVLNYRLQVTSRLFDLLSDQSEIKHPLCEECADFIMDQMDSRLEQIEEECKEYKDYLESLQRKQRSSDGMEDEKKILSELEEKASALEKEEKDLLRELEEVEHEQKRVDSELEKQKEELRDIDADEEKYWQEYNCLKRNFFLCEDEILSLSNQQRYAQSQLDKLKRTNVFNVTFHIWYVLFKPCVT